MSASSPASPETLPPPPSIPADQGSSDQFLGSDGGLPPEPAFSPDASSNGGGSRDYSSRTKNGNTRGTDSSRNVLLYLLPLGVGQFVNGKPLLGVLVAAAQVGAFGYGFQKDSLAKSKTKSINAYSAENCATEEQLAECQQFVDSGTAYVNTLNTQSMYGYIAAAAAYGLGVTQAFLDTPTKVAKKKKRRGFNLSANSALNTDSSDMDLYDVNESYAFDWRVDVVPHYNAISMKSEPALTLNLDLQF